MRRSLMCGLTALIILTLTVLSNAQTSSVRAAGGPDAVRDSRATPALDGLDDFIQGAMKDWKVPGVAVAVIQGNRVIFSKAFGYRDLERHLPVTLHTRFAVGSISKSFTVTNLGMLIDEGNLDWDEPVRKAFPSFRMFDPVVTEQMTIRDLVTHRSGLPSHDAVWYTSDFSRDDLVRRLQYLEPSKPLRTTFQYNNLMFMTAGYIAGQIMGMTWEKGVQQRILDPLEMPDTNFSVLVSQKSSDFAEPYRKGSDLKAELKREPFDAQCPDTCALGPAGEVNSSVSDLSRYVLFHMNRGKLDGRQLLSENNALQMQTPQMTIQGAPDYKELSDDSYGMGFFISTYRGHKRIWHGGNLDGFTAQIAFLPAERIGVVVLTNLDENPLPGILAMNVFDRLLGLDQVPWNQRLLERELQERLSQQEAKDKKYTPHKTGTHPSHDLADYVGEYENPGYGIVSIAADGKGLKVEINRMSERLEHFHYDIFQVPDDPQADYANLKVLFFSDLSGDISSLAIPFEPKVRDIVFTRRAEKQLLERSFIEGFTGEYSLAGSPVLYTVSLRGDHDLILGQAGEEATELIPRRGTSFDLKGFSGFRIEFKKDATGKVNEAALIYPDSTIIIKKKK